MNIAVVDSKGKIRAEFRTRPEAIRFIKENNLYYECKSVMHLERSEQ